MFLKQYSGWELEGAGTVSIRCPHCHNTSEHFVYVAPYGFQLGVIFAAKPLVGKRKYFLACPVCGWLTQEISKEQAYALRKQS